MNTSNPPLPSSQIKTGWTLLCIHLFLMYSRPQEIFTFLKPLHLPGIITLLLIFWVVKNLKPFVFKNPTTRFVLIFSALCGVSFLWAVHVAAYKIAISWFIQLTPICIAFTLLATNLERYKTLLGLWAVVHLIVYLVIFRNGGKGPGSFLADENDAALGVAMSIPIIFYFSNWSGLTKLQTISLRTIFLIAFVAIIATRSRGGLLGLVSVAGMLWLFSRIKLRIFFIGLFATIALGSIALNFLPEGYLEDVQNISDPNDSTRNARLNTWEVSWIMYKHNPIFGVGAGNFPWNAKYYQESASWWYYGAKSFHGRQTHSMYFELLADLATVGIVIYFGFIFSTMKKLYRAQKILSDTKKKYDSDLINLAYMSRALFVSVIAYLVSGAFISVSYYPHVAMWGALSYATLEQYYRLSTSNSPKSPNSKK